MDQFDNMLAKFQPIGAQPVSLHHRTAAVSVRRRQTLQISAGAVFRQGRTDLADRRRRHDRTDPRRAADARPVHAPRGVHPVRRDGLRLFPRPHVQGSDTPVFLPLLNGGTAAILFCFACLYLATAGGGPISVDAMREEARSDRSHSERKRSNPSGHDRQNSDCFVAIAASQRRCESVTPRPSHRAAPPARISNCAAPATCGRCARAAPRSGG